MTPNIILLIHAAGTDFAWPGGVLGCHVPKRLEGQHCDGAPRIQVHTFLLALCMYFWGETFPAMQGKELSCHLPEL